MADRQTLLRRSVHRRDRLDSKLRGAAPSRLRQASIAAKLSGHAALPRLSAAQQIDRQLLCFIGLPDYAGDDSSPLRATAQEGETGMAPLTRIVGSICSLAIACAIAPEVPAACWRSSSVRYSANRSSSTTGRARAALSASTRSRTRRRTATTWC